MRPRRMLQSFTLVAPDGDGPASSDIAQLIFKAGSCNHIGCNDIYDDLEQAGGCHI